jgi:hypothetical protein
VVNAVRATNSPRVTAADVAAAGGLSLSDAKSGVVSLASALGGESALEESMSGDSADFLGENVERFVVCWGLRLIFRAIFGDFNDLFLGFGGFK